MGTTWICDYCQKLYPTKEQARECYHAHDLLFVPFSREDLAKLMQFIMFKNDELLSPAMMRNIHAYLRNSSNEDKIPALHKSRLRIPNPKEAQKEADKDEWQMPSM